MIPVRTHPFHRIGPNSAHWSRPTVHDYLQLNSATRVRLEPSALVGSGRVRVVEFSYYRISSGSVYSLTIDSRTSQILLSLIRAGFDTLEARREQLTERFFRRSVLPETSCLHYLLASKRNVSVTSRLLHARTLELLKCRTVKFRHSFIPYCLDHYV